MKITLRVNPEIVNKFCAICEAADFYVDVRCGSIVVDGTSVLGVFGLCGKVVEIVPITADQSDVDRFYELIRPLGAVLED